MKVGIELETLCEIRPENGVGDYHDGYIVNELDSIGCGNWTAEQDSSLNPVDEESGIEFVSPPFAFNDRNILKLSDAVQDIRDKFDARVNQSCGTHISVSLPALDSQQYRRLYYVGRLLQQGMYASTGSITRETGCYAMPLKELPYTGDDAIAEGVYSSEDRCNWLNLVNVEKANRKYTGTRSRCEYRIFSGTTDSLRVITWTQLCVCLTKYAIRTDSPLPVQPISRPKGVGEGRYYLDCLLKTIGWRDGTCSDYEENSILNMSAAAKVVEDLADTYDSKKYGARNRGGIL